MGRKFTDVLQDVSIYQEYPNRNTGYDEILEIGKTRKTSGSVHALLQFSMTSVSSSMSAGTVPGDATHYLNLKIAGMDNLIRNQTIEFYPISESWDEGTGCLVQDVLNPRDGAQWNLKDNTATSWSLAGGSTGSMITDHTFEWKPADIRLDITSTVNGWISGSANAQGVLIKIPTADEDNVAVLSNIKFFSKQTHTIHPPQVESVWDNNTFVTGSLNSSIPEDFSVFIRYAPSNIKLNSVNRLRFGVRTQYPLKTFGDRFSYSNSHYLPSGSKYSVLDEAANVTVVPFDVGSTINCDATGSYVDLGTENMYVHRTYKVLLSVPVSYGTKLIDTDHRFRIVP